MDGALHLAGQVGIEDGEIPDDLPAQVAQAYQNIRHVLAQFDVTMDDIVDETFFVTDMDDCMAKVPGVLPPAKLPMAKSPRSVRRWWLRRPWLIQDEGGDQGLRL